MQKLLTPAALFFFMLFAVLAGRGHRVAASASFTAGFFIGLCACGSPSEAERASVRKSQASHQATK